MASQPTAVTKHAVSLLSVFASVVAVTAVLPSRATADGPPNQVQARAIDIELGNAVRRPKEQLLSSGALYPLLDAAGVLAQRAANNPGGGVHGLSISTIGTQGCPNVYLDLLTGRSNIRVNQDCSLRRQAEEVIAVSPLNPRIQIAGQNDSRVGFNKCGYAWSHDGGLTWGDQVPPFYQFVMKDGHTADACSDPTATFDADGNAYVGGILFQVNFAASAFVVAKSNAGVNGAFYHSPVVQPFQLYRDSPLGVVASDNNPAVFNDKEFIVADASPASPKKNNVYATWTRFSLTDSPIYFSQSTDGGATWSPGVEISGASASLCTAFSGEANPNACDQDQGSQPVVGRDGTIYVTFTNGNTPTTGVNQHLVVSCPASANCASPASWSAPAKSGDDYGLQPVGPAGGCPPGRQCLPPNDYRMDDFVEGSISVDDAGNLYQVWADLRNGAPNCTVGAAPPCDNDVFYSYSKDGGATWSAAYDITPRSRFGATAQWMPWSAVSPDGKTLWVAYYDRSYGNCEATGCNDITLAAVRTPATPSPKVTYQRLTTSSMPNLTLANNPIQDGFLGDYMWVTVDRSGKPYVVWADTRGLNGTVEEDIYTYKGVLP